MLRPVPMASGLLHLPLSFFSEKKMSADFVPVTPFRSLPWASLRVEVK
ncbi:Uncharacterised protein [Segatella copri]|nr:Uncharacterised protein [Segatella copri]